MSTIDVLDATGNTVSINTPNADGQATMANSRPVVIASDQSAVPVSGPLTNAQLRASAVPVNQVGVSASGSLAALNAVVELTLNGATGFAIDLRGTFVATVTFQGTIDGTNWFTIFVLPAASAVNIAAVSSATGTGQWWGQAGGLLAVRATATAFTSGSATVVLRAMQAAGVVFNMPSGATTQSVTVGGTLPAIVGQAAHDAVLAGNPVRVAARAVTANYTAVANGDVADIVCTLVGAQILKPFSIPELDWQDARALTTTTAATARAAQAAGIRNYVTGAQFSNSGASAIDVIILDGVTEIWRATVAPNGFVNATFQTPLRGTAATALNVNLSAAGTVRSNVQGFSAP